MLNNKEIAGRQESLFLRACRRQPNHRTPVWLMRQAGRYMKEYRDVREKVSFLDLCKNPDLVAEVTCFAAHKLKVDAAILFSDILLIVEPLGFQLVFAKDHGPVIQNPFRSDKDLPVFDPGKISVHMEFVFNAVRATRAALDPSLPLIGFAGAPFTVCSYLVEGGKSRDFAKTKNLMDGSPELWRNLMDKVSSATIEYIRGQVDAGVDVIQLFDTWAGCLTPAQYEGEVFPFVRKIISEIRCQVPVILFGLGCAPFFPIIKGSGAQVIGVDTNTSLTEAWKALGPISLQGNLDPKILLEDKTAIQAGVQKIIQETKNKNGHIFNLGHGVLPQTPVENVLFLVDLVRKLTEKI